MKLLTAASLLTALLGGCLLEGRKDEGSGKDNSLGVESDTMFYAQTGLLADADTLLAPHQLEDSSVQLVSVPIEDTLKYKAILPFGSCEEKVLLGRKNKLTHEVLGYTTRLYDDGLFHPIMDQNVSPLYLAVRIFVPRDSSFTHYRLEIDCTPPKE